LYNARYEVQNRELETRHLQLVTCILTGKLVNRVTNILSALRYLYDIRYTKYEIQNTNLFFFSKIRPGISN
jgi:hypothetical protein